MLEYKLHLVTNPLFIIIPVIFMIVVIGVSAFIPSRRASKVSPIEAIRQNDDIKINKRRLEQVSLLINYLELKERLLLRILREIRKNIELLLLVYLLVLFYLYLFLHI